jgi:hypothetical protein
MSLGKHQALHSQIGATKVINGPIIGGKIGAMKVIYWHLSLVEKFVP